MFISEVTGSVLDYPARTQNAIFSLSPPTCRLIIMVSTTQILCHIKSREFIGHIQKHFITTSPLTYVTMGIQDFVKCCFKSWVHLDLRPEIILFDGLQPHRIILFFTCYLYTFPCFYPFNIQGRWPWHAILCP